MCCVKVRSVKPSIHGLNIPTSQLRPWWQWREGHSTWNLFQPYCELCSYIHCGHPAMKIQKLSANHIFDLFNGMIAHSVTVLIFPNVHSLKRYLKLIFFQSQVVTPRRMTLSMDDLQHENIVRLLFTEFMCWVVILLFCHASVCLFNLISYYTNLCFYLTPYINLW